MNYKIGDTVVHWTRGVGKVIAIEEIDLSEKTQQYYVVEIQLLKLWVPVEEACKGSIRFPMESSQFKNVIDILRKPGEMLPENQYQRKMALHERMQKRTPEGLCHVIRALADRARHHTLNQNDTQVLCAAEEYLLEEWVLSLGAERSNALSEMKVFLQEN